MDLMPMLATVACALLPMVFPAIFTGLPGKV